ncbi:acyl-CoA dehydrogenase family protein [Streptomyces californicus]|uniref:acyl-CoA dehydrogenase family protein n=1 Tax=Streptomyces californicus TaxID=67351 RepID=UPI0037B07A21
MRFAFTEEQERFRREVRDFLAEDRVREIAERAHRLPPREEPGNLDVYRWLGEKRWLAVNWPEAYGGLGRGIVEKSILTEELIRARVPDLVHIVSVDIVGAVLMMAGTKAQKAGRLPALASGEQTAAVLYTEPQAGSDLAALETRAEPDGDGWRLHGRKVYSLKTQFADFALCAARTTVSEVAFHGITLFLVPLRTPGVQVRTVPNLTDEQFCDVTLDGIRLSRDDVVGEVDGGWQVLNEVLPVERTGLEFQAKARRLLDEILRRAAKDGSLDDPAHQQKLVELDAHARAAHLMAWRVISQIRAGELDGVSTAMAKLYTTELFRRISAYGLEVGGLEATLSAWDASGDAGTREAAHREGTGITLSAGTSEIMRYLIASEGLRLLT